METQITLQLKQLVKEVTGVDINQQSRKREIIEARAIYYKILKQIDKKKSLQSIGASVKHVLTSDDLTFYTTGVATADAAVPEAVATAKGDILVASASAVVDNLAVGTNDHVLTADSTQTLGVKWAAIPAPTADASTATVLMLMGA